MRVDLRDAGRRRADGPLDAPKRHRRSGRLEVALIDPDQLRLAVAQKKRREIPVVPTIAGQPPRGYKVYRAIAHPESLLVEGPEARIAAVSKLGTEPIHVGDQTEMFMARVGAVPDGSDLRVVDPRPLDVSVYIDLAPVDATIDRVPVVAAGRRQTSRSCPRRSRSPSPRRPR